MQTRLMNLIVAALTLSAAPLVAAPLGTVINYQGRLTSGGNGANGQYDMRFRLYNDASAGSQVGITVTVAPLQVSSGLFTAPIDFGSGVFDGTDYWLEIAVRPNGSVSAYTVLTPRQALNAVANSLWSVNAGTASTASGVAVNAVTASGIQNNSITAGKIAGGQVVKSLNGLMDSVSLVAGAGLSLTPSGGNTLTFAASGGPSWSLTGNAGTTPGANFLGTTDNQPLDLYANYTRGLRLQYNGRSSVIGGLLFSSWGMNMLGGLDANFIGGDVVGATIAGGGAGSGSFIFPSYSSNAITADFGSIGGGAGNLIRGIYGVAPGGYQNEANGNYTFAAGRRARANHDGAFVWNSYNQPATSFSPTRFHVFAQNGFSVDYDVQRQDGGGSHWAGFGVFPGQTLSTWTGAYLEDNGDWHSRYVIAYGEGNEQAYLGGDGIGADVQIGSLNPTVSNVAAYNPATGQYMNMFVRTLTITGGADLAEPFQVSGKEILEGSVMVIDESAPGHLKMSTRAYDTQVAGVVSGANGVQPGIQMSQRGAIEGTQNVALTGRVYVRADASQGAINPGDLLTTSSTPGHAMKVTDHARAQGAILGKAMSALKEGRDMVLVLVTLQ
jgi:hypothetical protein